MFNCLNKDTYLLEQKCLTTNIVYRAKVTSNNRNYQEKVYFGLCETTFKKQFSNHKKSFDLHKYKNETELSNEIWQIKDLAIIQKLKGKLSKNLFHITHKQNAT